MDTDSGTVTYKGTSDYSGNGLRAGAAYYNLTFNARADLAVERGRHGLGFAFHHGRNAQRGVRRRYPWSGDFSRTGPSPREGKVAFTGSGASTIGGATTFYNFTVRSSRKTIRFTAIRRRRFAAGGNFTIPGTAGSKILLVKHDPHLAVDPRHLAGGISSVQYASIQTARHPPPTSRDVQHRPRHNDNIRSRRRGRSGCSRGFHAIGPVRRALSGAFRATGTMGSPSPETARHQNVTNKRS